MIRRDFQFRVGDGLSSPSDFLDDTTTTSAWPPWSFTTTTRLFGDDAMAKDRTRGEKVRTEQGSGTITDVGDKTVNIKWDNGKDAKVSNIRKDDLDKIEKK
jgi:hypothetical protein